MNSLSSATPTVAPPNPLSVIVDLLSALPLGSWMWVAVTIAVLALGAYAAHRALTPADVEPLGSRQAREMQEARR